MTVYEVGSFDSRSYIAMELADGKSLRESISSGPLPTRKIVEIAGQIASGLARAHEVGIVHRDLKPENVMVCRSGLVKIVDFGLAKWLPHESGAGGAQATLTAPTEAGVVLGTVGYMSPEQASGQPVDFRSDQFSFGSILYEMSTGKRAFEKPTKPETLSAIIRAEPEPIALVNPRAPAPLRWIVERCHAKDPKNRYTSTDDLARDLALLREHLSEVSGPGETARAPVPTRRWIRGAAVAALAVLALAAAFAVGRRGARTEPPSIRRLTFREGGIFSARFAPDEQTTLYAASWESRPYELFVLRIGSPESRPLGVPNARLLALSRTGELALMLNPRYNRGTLARMGMLSMGAPREVLKAVNWADWSPDGRELAIVHDVGERNTLEYPIGHILYQHTAGYLSHPRVSRDGGLVAYLDHPRDGDDMGGVVVIDRAGKSRVLATGFESVQGLAWSPDGREVWFTGAPSGLNRALYAVTLSGRKRTLATFMGLTSLQDVASSGRALLTQDVRTEHVMALAPEEESERELTWLDLSSSVAISADGRTVLMLESGEGGGPGYSIFLRNTDGSPAVRLGDGEAQALSPDGKWVLAIRRQAGTPSLVLYPTAAGEIRTIPLHDLEPQLAQWLPDGKQILLSAGEAGHASRLYLLDATGGRPRPISPDGFNTVTADSVSPEGRLVVVWGPGNRLYLFDLGGGEPAQLPGAAPGDFPCGWSTDGRHLYVTGVRSGRSTRVDRLDVRTGAREMWKELGPQTGAGNIHVTPDGRSYVYTYVRRQEDLYLVEGLR